MQTNAQRHASLRTNALILCGIAVALLAFSLFASWLADGSGMIKTNLRSASFCVMDECQNMSNSELVDLAAKNADPDDKPSSLWAPIGWLTTGLIGIAVIGLGFSLYWVGTKRPGLPPYSATSAALLSMLVGLVAGCIFVATKPGGMRALGVSTGFFAFGAGVVVGILGVQMLVKSTRPPEPEPEIEM